MTAQTQQTGHFAVLGKFASAGREGCPGGVFGDEGVGPVDQVRDGPHADQGKRFGQAASVGPDQRALRFPCRRWDG